MIFIHFEEMLISEKNQENYFFKNGNWNLEDYPQSTLATIGTYYALTTLSTTGFGDLYPITNVERIVCLIMFSLGVVVFSYIVGELSNLIGYSEYNSKKFGKAAK